MIKLVLINSPQFFDLLYIHYLLVYELKMRQKLFCADLYARIWYTGFWNGKFFVHDDCFDYNDGFISAYYGLDDLKLDQYVICYYEIHKNQ